MPKKVKVHPNERIDIPDFERDTEYAAESVAQLNERLFQARYPLIVEGFRVRIEDQASNPGEITIFNGTALDRDGKILHDEDQNSVSKSITLPSASTPFYVEIEFVETESDTDARAFWDPTFDQVDPIPDGKEFSLNVATRKTPSWRIVSPVSTTDFEVNTNPDSNKIPIAKLTTNADGEIDGASNPELVQVFPSTVSEQAVSSGDSSIRVFDSRLFNAGDTVTVDVGGSSPDTGLAISSIDYDNHIISFSGTFSSDHDEGAIVRRTSGTGRIMEQEVSPGIGFLGAHPDAANYAFQGNEIRGGALVQSKETFGERNDLNIRSLKDQIDALAAVIRELKFGSTKPSVTSAAPPDSFVSEPRWVDNAGGVTGARANSVSIGDGSSTFGDFNGTGESTFQAAIDSLPSDGGLIFVKNGNYSINDTITIDKPIVIKGVGAASNLRNVGADPAFLITTTGHVKFEDVSIPDDGVDEDSIEIQSDVTLILDNVTEVYRINITNGAESRIFARGVEFVDTIITTSALSGSVTNSSFIDCTFAGNISDVFWIVVTFTECVFNGTLSSSFVSAYFESCNFTDVVTFLPNTSRVSLQNCVWSGSATIDVQAVNSLYFKDCTIEPDLDPGTVGEAVLISNDTGIIDFQGCHFNPSVTGTSDGNEVSMILTASSDISSLTLSNCTLEVPAGAFGIGVGLASVDGNSVNAHIISCSFLGFVSSITSANYGGSLSVESTKIDGNGQSLTDTFYGIQLAVGGVLDFSVNNCLFIGYQNVDGDITGIDISTSANVEISNTTFDSIGGSDADISRAIAVDAAGTNATVIGNIIDSVRAGTTVEALYISAGSTGRVTAIGNVINGLNGGLGSTNTGIRIVDGNNTVVEGNVIDATGSDIDYGIYLSGSSADVLINNNIVEIDDQTFAAIRVITSSTDDISIYGNKVNGVEAGNVGIYLSLPEGSSNIRIDQNEVLEAAFDNDNQGIVVEGQSADRVENVSICGNIIHGDIDSMGNRNSDSVGILLQDCDIVSINNNMVRWVTDSVDGAGGIQIDNALMGTVNDNIVYPDATTGTNEIKLLSGAEYFLVDGNIVTNGTTDGTINSASGTNDITSNNKLS